MKIKTFVYVSTIVIALVGLFTILGFSLYIGLLELTLGELILWGVYGLWNEYCKKKCKELIDALNITLYNMWLNNIMNPQILFKFHISKKVEIDFLKKFKTYEMTVSVFSNVGIIDRKTIKRINGYYPTNPVNPKDCLEIVVSHDRTLLDSNVFATGQYTFPITQSLLSHTQTIQVEGFLEINTIYGNIKPTFCFYPLKSPRLNANFKKKKFEILEHYKNQ